MFTVDQLTFGDDIKDSATTFDEFDLVIRFFPNRGRQTGGLRGIVSLNAVGDGNLHGEGDNG